MRLFLVKDFGFRIDVVFINAVIVFKRSNVSSSVGLLLLFQGVLVPN